MTAVRVYIYPMLCVFLEEKAIPGASTEDIDAFVHDKCIQLEVYPSPLGYRGFPKSVCTSVNNVACHGIPDDRRLQKGDVINIDITVGMMYSNDL